MGCYISFTITMNPISTERQRAISLLERLPGEKLAQAIAALQELGENLTPYDPEAELLQIISRRLPLKDQQRLEILRDRLQAETLSVNEHYELLQWVDRIEIQDAERATALFQLAQLRDVDFQTILQEFPTNIGSDVIRKCTPIS